MVIRYIKCLLIFFLFSVKIAAQEEIKVENFTLSTTTNYANLEGSIEFDANGEKCAFALT